MRHFLLALLFLTFNSSAFAKSYGYTLQTTPWSTEKFKVCPTPTENGLRAIIFEAEIEEWSHPVTTLLTTRFKASADGIKEVVVKKELNLTAYHLKEQKIGYLDDKNNWVDENGTQINNFGQLKIISGEKTQADAKANYSKFVYKTNIELERAAAIQKIHGEAPCTVFSVGHYDKLETETYYDFVPNNPYQCDDDKGLQRNQKLNYTKKSYRPIASIPDGSSYYIKYPGGKIITYGWTGVELLYDKHGSLICDWNDLGLFIGYELIDSSQ
jgi:hypothetical protein